METGSVKNSRSIYAFCLPKMDIPRRFLNSLKGKLGDCWSRISSIRDSSATEEPNYPAPSQALDLEASPSTSAIEQDNDSRTEIAAVPESNAPYNFDWTTMVVGICLTSAVEIAMQSLQSQIKLPLRVHLLSLAMIVAFSSFFISNFISPYYFPRFSRALIHVGKLSVFVAFFLAITIPFSLPFQLVTWSVFVLSLLVIVYGIATRGLLYRT